MKKFVFVFCCIGFLFAISNVSAQETKKLRIMTYNLRYGELASMERLAAFISEQKPDIVAIQEVDCMTRRPSVKHQHDVHFITELGYYTKMFPLYGKTIPHAGGWYGIGILTKYPYVNVEKTMLPRTGNAEPRALLAATVEIGEDTIVFACSHLDYTTSEARQKQVKEIKSVLENQPYPVIVGGDFNAEPDSPEIAEMFKQWAPFSNKDFTFSSSKPSCKIDYLFGFPAENWKLLSTEVIPSLQSDHMPIVSEVELVIPQKR
ncbi:MAG: endonuclease/exonuclease/phosphatase family protein [Bacteroidaceae bacterium]|nr:endonuclease/exonuclease/phosphatase family protein [Bacteroidaceae bacterium]